MSDAPFILAIFFSSLAAGIVIGVAGTLFWPWSRDEDDSQSEIEALAEKLYVERSVEWALGEKVAAFCFNDAEDFLVERDRRREKP